MDPFTDLIHLLRPRATLWGRIQGTAPWSLSFRKRDDLLFCWVDAGECFITRQDSAATHLRTGDFALIRTSSPFTLTTDPGLTPQDSEDLVARTGSTGLVFGDPHHAHSSTETRLRCGRFVFSTSNEILLWSLLPALMHLPAGQQISWRVRSLLTMNDDEGRHPGPGSDLIVSRLMELILLEVLRSEVPRLAPESHGLLSGLADPVIARALASMHGDVAAAWTVAKLARISHTSRSTFAARFCSVMGLGPMAYLANWRIALAKDKLSCTDQTVEEIALGIGFLSSSAFSTAFTGAVGVSPKRYRSSHRRTSG